MKYKVKMVEKSSLKEKINLDQFPKVLQNPEYILRNPRMLVTREIFSDPLTNFKLNFDSPLHLFSVLYKRRYLPSYMQNEINSMIKENEKNNNSYSEEETLEIYLKSKPLIVAILNLFFEDKFTLQEIDDFIRNYENAVDEKGRPLHRKKLSTEELLALYLSEFKGNK